MLAILKNKARFDEKLAESIANCMVKIQNMRLRQTPSIAEAVDWGNYLQSMFGEHLENLEDPEEIKYTLGAIAKNKEDERILKNGNLDIFFDEAKG